MKQKLTHTWRRDRIGKEAKNSTLHRKAIAEVKRRARLLKTDK